MTVISVISVTYMKILNLRLTIAKINCHQLSSGFGCVSMAPEPNESTAAKPDFQHLHTQFFGLSPSRKFARNYPPKTKGKTQ